jgi:hypothetical protein
MRFFLGVSLAMAAALAGHPLAAQAQSETASLATDPARASAATQVVDKLWPLGTYRRMMDGTLSKMMDQIMASMFDIPAEDLAAMTGKSAEAAKSVNGKSMGEIATEADPHFRERMKLSMDAMMREMIPLMEKMEPQVRKSLSAIYARNYTVAQLGEMNAFFSTPTGQLYARNSMLVFMDPEMVSSMQGFVPEMMKAMPDILKKVEAATAHLPPAPSRRTTSDGN